MYFKKKFQNIFEKKKEITYQYEVSVCGSCDDAVLHGCRVSQSVTEKKVWNNRKWKMMSISCF